MKVQLLCDLFPYNPEKVASKPDTSRSKIIDKIMK